MSRHAFERDGSSWAVGWDESTSTYFAQRENEDRDKDDVTGTSVGQHTRVASLLDELQDQVTVPDNVRAQLEAQASGFSAAALERAHTRVDELAAREEDLQAHARSGYRVCTTLVIPAGDHLVILDTLEPEENQQ